jgi:hypothetical protein
MKDELMCDYKGPMEMISDPSDAPEWIRCPKCSRRLHPQLHDCHYPYDTPCWHYRIPPHKRKQWWKIGTKKKTSKGEKQ